MWQNVFVIRVVLRISCLLLNIRQHDYQGSIGVVNNEGLVYPIMQHAHGLNDLVRETGSKLKEWCKGGDP
ncbi:hypothetical protein C0Q70_04020 [Pomacea canaliculata]|uniref:Uncharacterized protein n=1 Tax=Pomacea canaliculata TaxID=400727 RepID=A0A2T7PUH1_POMCA|nr:hypothetical protein C0Q70_04020 [Pomacea canaliculata]